MHRWWSSSEGCQALLERQKVEYIQPRSGYLSIWISLPATPRQLLTFTLLCPPQTEEYFNWICPPNPKHQPANSAVFAQCYTHICTLLCTTPSIVYFSRFMTTFSPLFPQYVTGVFLLFPLNCIVHWTNTKLDCHYTSLYSCHQTECNDCTYLMKKLNVLLRTLICISVTTLYAVAPITAHVVSLVSPYILQSYVSLFNASVIVCFIYLFIYVSILSSAFAFKAAFRWWSRLMVPLLLFHSTSQDLIGCNQHDTDDESNCKSAYQALSYTCLFDLLRRTGTWGVKCGEVGGRRE